MIYLEESDFEEIFSLVSERYTKIEEVPKYRDDPDGMEKLIGVIERARMDNFYPELFDKASHILIGINKGHFFGNGNKRLALVTVLTFLGKNGYDLKNRPKANYKRVLSKLFPEHTKWQEFPEFTGTDFGTFNLSIIIAESGKYKISHDSLKERVRMFFSKYTDELGD